MYKQPVFIVGVPRTGTTLIQSILCKSGYYFPIPETHFFSKAALDLPENNLDDVQKKKLIRILKKKSKIKIDEGELQTTLAQILSGELGQPGGMKEKRLSINF